MSESTDFLYTSGALSLQLSQTQPEGKTVLVLDSLISEGRLPLCFRTALQFKQVERLTVNLASAPVVGAAICIVLV